MLLPRNRYKKYPKKRAPVSEEQRRRRRERFLIAVIIAVVGLLAFALARRLYYNPDSPVSSQILMFILININLLLLLLLIFLVFRNLVKLLYDRRRKVMGVKLRTRLVLAFVSLTLIPTTVLFLFSINFITSSIEFWFNVPVETALENSLRVGQTIYQELERGNRFLLERIAYQIDKKALLGSRTDKALDNYLQVVQREFNLKAIEVYGADFKRVALVVDTGFDRDMVAGLSAGDLRKGATSGDIFSISTATREGQVLRTVGPVPFEAAQAAVLGFVVVSRLLPADLAESMAAITRGVEEYKQITLFKRPIQTYYYLTLTIVALLVVFCAVWLGFYLAKTITIPIMRLADGTRRVAEGDLSFALNLQADDEIGTLVKSFNQMTRDLRLGREQLELSAQILRRQNTEIEERRRYMEIVLKNVSAGVITLDGRGVITTLNTSAAKMLNLNVDEILGRSYEVLLTGRQLELAEAMMDELLTSQQERSEIPLRLTIDGRPRTFLAYFNVLKDETGRHMGIVMVIDDLTELERAQRMAAWREVARRIAHEVKNPLTPISLSAQRLNRRYSSRINEPVFDECTQMIIDQVELIRNLVNEFSAFARFPTANLKPCELPAIVEETVALYREGLPAVAFHVMVRDSVPLLSLDRQQIKQALINLVDNAIAAVRSRGTITLTVTPDPGSRLVRIEVADDGVGLSDEAKTRVFEPDFSTKKSGTGLGLAIVSSIVAEHRGRVSVRDNQPRGAVFVIELPL